MLRRYTWKRCQKKVYEENEEVRGEIDENESKYRIDAELGRFNVTMHIIREGEKKVFDTSRSFFIPVCSREYFRTACLNELLMSFSCDESYRECEDKINRIRWQEGDITQSRTIANIIEREGREIQEEIERKADVILKEHGFDKDGKPLDWDVAPVVIPESDLIPEEFVNRAVDEYNKDKEKDVQIEVSELHEVFENPFGSVNISVDEVGVKKQKENGRSKNSKKKEHKEYVRNTVIHVQNGQGQYILNGLGALGTLRILAAFLLNNGLFNKGTLLFFVDGARDLHTAINTMFGWIPFRIILDWYHGGEMQDAVKPSS